MYDVFLVNERSLNLVYFCLLTFAFFFLIMHLIKYLTPAKILVSSKSFRSNHIGLARQIGGLALFPVSICAFVTWSAFYDMNDAVFYNLIAGLFILFLVGFIDDLMNLSILIRLVSQIIAATLLFYGVISVLGLDKILEIGLFNLPAWLFMPLVLLGIIYWINVVNFMDGLDLMIVVGLGIPLLFAGVAIFFFYPQGHLLGAISLFSAFCLFSFGMAFNFPPATIFLGDSGSLYLGGVSASVIVYLGFAVSPFLGLLIFGYFGLDAFSTLLLRLWRRQNIFASHSMHAYQCAYRSGLSVKYICTLIVLVNLILLGLAFLFLITGSILLQSILFVFGLFVTSILIYYFRNL